MHAKKLNRLLINSIEEIVNIDIRNPMLYLEKIRNVIDNKTNCDIFFKVYSMHLGNVISCNFSENNTIEFRCPNATLDKAIWQNNINFFVNFLLSCKKEFDIKEILSYISEEEDKTFELVDLVFEKEIDKQNFLIQTFNLNENYDKELQYYQKSFKYMIL